MKQYISLFSTLLLLCLSSCSNDVTGEAVVLPDGECSYTMSFDGNITDYGADVVSRASTVSVSNGDKMYMVFYSGSTKVNYGTATYSGGKWTVTPNSKFTNGSGTAKLYYFVGAKSSTASSVTCDAKTAVYACTTATWQFASNTITIKGTLTPQYSRIHFDRGSNASFTLGTMTVPGSYSIADGTMATQSVSSTSLSITSSSPSDYVYFDTSSLSALTVNVNNVTYSKNSVPSLSSVKSIIIALPTSSSYIGWSSSADKKDEEEKYAPPTTQDITPSATGYGDNENWTVTSENGREYVDLGLSVKWATMNVGALKPEGYGHYFAWGEVYSKDDYSWSTYKWCNGSETTMKKYCNLLSFGTVDNKTTLDKEDDVASVRWGGKWRMPTHTELDELLTKCTWILTSVNGVRGRKVTGPNGNSIFLPDAGYRSETNIKDVGASCYCWSSSLFYSYPAMAVCLDSDGAKIGSSRYYGQSVRAVCP